MVALSRVLRIGSGYPTFGYPLPWLSLVTCLVVLCLMELLGYMVEVSVYNLYFTGFGLSLLNPLVDGLLLLCLVFDGPAMNVCEQILQVRL